MVLPVWDKDQHRVSRGAFSHYRLEWPHTLQNPNIGHPGHCGEYRRPLLAPWQRDFVDRFLLQQNAKSLLAALVDFGKTAATLVGANEMLLRGVVDASLVISDRPVIRDQWSDMARRYSIELGTLFEDYLDLQRVSVTLQSLRTNDTKELIEGAVKPKISIMKPYYSAVCKNSVLWRVFCIKKKYNEHHKPYLDHFPGERMVCFVENPDSADSGVEHSVNLGARIRTLRRKRKLTVNELAQHAGVSVGMISQVERGIANPSLRILERLRLALDIPLSDLLEADPADSPQAEHAAFVRRANQRPNFDVGTVGLHKEMLSPHGNHDIQFMIINIPPQACADEVLIGPGEKAGLMLEGRLILSVGKEQTEISSGDSFQFDSMLPHFVRNPDDTIARVLWIMNTRTPVAHL